VQETLQRYKKLMTKMMAHTPDTDDLVVIGTSAAETLKHQSLAPVTLERVVSRLSQKNPEAHAHYTEAAAVRKQEELEKAAVALKVCGCALHKHFDIPSNSFYRTVVIA
jgi:hypothetical protein